MTNAFEFDADNNDFSFDDIEFGIAREVELNLIGQDVCEQMDQWGIQRVVDTDIERQDALQTAYIESLREHETDTFRTRLGGEERYILDEHHDWVTLACTEKLVRYMERQATVLHFAAELLYESYQPESRETQFAMANVKKLTQAFLLTDYNRDDPQDELLSAFFDKVAPGTSLDPSNAKDNKLLENAKYEIAKQRAAQADVLARTKRIMGVEDDDQSEYAANMTLALMAIRTTALASDSQHRGFTVRSRGYEIGLADEVIDKLVAFYVETLPTLNYGY